MSFLVRVVMLLRDFCSFPGFAQERFELSPVSNVSLILRTWLLSDFFTQNAEVDGERKSKRIKVCNGPVFGGEKPFVQHNSFESSEVTRANQFIRLEPCMLCLFFCFVIRVSMM